MTVITAQDNTSNDFVNWTITVPKLFRKWSRRRAIKSQIRFVVKNTSEEFIQIKLELWSRTKLLIFRSITKRRVGKNRIKETTEALSEVIERGIESRSETIFTFPFHYRPQLPLQRTSNLMLGYMITGIGREGMVVFRSGPHDLTIPIE